MDLPVTKVCRKIGEVTERSGGHKKTQRAQIIDRPVTKRVPKGWRVTKGVLVANLNPQKRSRGHKKKAESAVN